MSASIACRCGGVIHFKILALGPGVVTKLEIDETDARRHAGCYEDA